MRNKHCIYQESHSIVSPIGIGSLKNFEAIAAGDSRLRLYPDHWGIPEPFFASLFDENDPYTHRLSRQGKALSRVESIAVTAAEQAIEQAGIDASAKEVLFVLSTTKGNVELLAEPHCDNPSAVYLWHSAQMIAGHFGNPNTPIVVSNACISGCAAQLTAFNMLQYSDKYKHIVVIGAEVLSKFIISGFQSFKALSPERCKPFDTNRCGLNLGEAAAAIVYGRCENPDTLPDGTIILEAGAICNDANHISGPSRTGEGLLRAIHRTTEGFDNKRIAFINAHGTATLYNDDMESVAINRAGLQDIPVNSLKGYYGHTLGAAGVMEVILSSIALQKHSILRSMGSDNPGTANPLNVCLQHGTTNGDAFLKLISGFGGSNAALLFSLKQGSGIRGQGSGVSDQGTEFKIQNSKFRIQESVGTQFIVSDYKNVACPVSTAEITIPIEKQYIASLQKEISTTVGTQNIDDQLTQQYRNIGINYPKFFKMDRLCKAGFLGTEILLKDLIDNERNNDDWGIILMNSASSLDNDRRFQQTITEDNYFPSPAIFVYTLANIVTGEIAIRHKIGGETSFYVMPKFDEALMTEMINQSFNANPKLTHILCGWMNVDKEECEVRMWLYRRGDAHCVNSGRRKDDIV